MTWWPASASVAAAAAAFPRAPVTRIFIRNTYTIYATVLALV